MLKSIARFFDNNLATDGQRGEADEHALHLATAALLIEMMHMDMEVNESEWTVVRQVLVDKFSLDPTEVGVLMQLAEKERESSTDYYQFTSLINRKFSHQRKIRLVEYLWQVAFADGQLHRHEDYMVRKVSELLYLSHSEFIGAKLRAQASG